MLWRKRGLGKGKFSFSTSLLLCLGTVRTNEKIVQVHEVVQENPHVSTRMLANEFDIGLSTAHQILTEDLDLHPYKAQTAQELLPGDPEARHQFALRMMAGRFGFFIINLKHLNF